MHEIEYLISIAQQTKDFIFDTKSDYCAHKPALMQIFLMQVVHENSPLLLVEMKFIPDESSFIFSQLQKLFYYIFRLDSHIYC